MRNEPGRTKRLALRGILIALAMNLSYLESLIPFNLPVPGAKFGLANTVTLFALMRLGFADAVLISILRVILTTVLFGNAVMMVYSLAGAVVSVLVMTLLFRMKRFGIIGISAAGAVAHNMGQCAAAAVMMHNRGILGYLPLLVVYGVISGVLTGAVTAGVMKRVDC